MQFRKFLETYDVDEDLVSADQAEEKGDWAKAAFHRIRAYFNLFGKHPSDDVAIEHNNYLLISDNSEPLSTPNITVYEYFADFWVRFQMLATGRIYHNYASQTSTPPPPKVRQRLEAIAEKAMTEILQERS